MRRLAILILGAVVLSCNSKRTIEEFSNIEKTEFAETIKSHIIADQSKELFAYAGLSKIKDSVLLIAKAQGISEYELKQRGFSDYRFYNDALRSILNSLAYSIGQNGQLEVTKETSMVDRHRVTYTINTSTGYFDFLDLDIITNGYQLFIGDLKLYSLGRKLSESLSIYLLDQAYVENLTTQNKNLNKAIDEFDRQNLERAIYFFNQVPDEMKVDPYLASAALQFSSNISSSTYYKLLAKISESRPFDMKFSLFWNAFMYNEIGKMDSARVYLDELESITGANITLHNSEDSERNN